MVLNVIAGVLEQGSILNATRTDRFARPASEAKIQMRHRAFVEWKPAILQRAHQINPAAR
jgi:hypothetical protein